MKKNMLCAALVVAALGACSSGPQFKIEGEVTGADGKMLYLEASALEGIVPMDSVKLDGDGSFTFKGERPASPEFYRLRVEDKVINLSVDSTETLTVEAPYENFATDYTVTGSANCEKIKELTLKQTRLQSRVDELSAAMNARALGVDDFQDSLAVLLKAYKDEVKINYIFSAPNTAAAYFALFQKLNNYLIFDPLNSKEDIRCFAAVATSLNQHFPHADRSKNLYNIVIKGMKNTRARQQQVVEVPETTVQETGVIDIDLRDLEGNVHRLSDLKGKVVILDFTIYQSAVSASHNYMLRDLYDKYAAQGLQIYQVSLDADEHYWKTTADNLPWICVRDGNGIYSSYATAYNVQNVPTLFLVSRANELVSRSETIKDLEKEVKALL
ncbi:MAG: AhpC/TSA family protein [Candidatus Bacteroides intestinipullorum]|uniref:AhpC/TSA family protein n=1 Tax=Candidatus Bacteroides intestinipullorum TaxID=2838471 RepID=A0A9E2NQF4_9BACE|nr:AhpC/TSA family protein [Candidatus Bacteroides intestinipullorum]